MKINKLNLISFGKFKNKEINLEDKINIIYGENEAGKTTVHNFIQGMFYGFLKPYVNRAIYTKEHEKYNPWNSDKYIGQLELNFEGKDYLIERNFKKQDEYTKVFMKDTLLDVTDIVNTGTSGRILQPGYHFFGFNDVVFNNTISIKQLGNKTDEHLAEEIKDKIINMSTSLDEDISVKNAISKIEDDIKEIGSKRAYTSKLGGIYESIDKLKEKKNNLQLKKDNYNIYIDKKSQLERKIKSLDLKLEDLKNIKNNILLNELISKNNKINKLEKEINDLNKIELELVKYKDLSVSDYSTLLELYNKNEENSNRIKEIQKEIELNLEKIESLKVKLNSNYSAKDYEKIENIIQSIENINNELMKNDLRFIYIDKKENEYKKVLYLVLFLIATTISILIIFSIFFTKTKLQLLGNILFIPLALVTNSKYRKYKGFTSRIDNYIEDIISKQEKLKDEKNTLEDEKISLFKKYDIKDDLDFKRNKEKLNIRYIREEEYRSEFSNLINRNLYLNGMKDKYIKEINKNNEYINSFLESNNFIDISEFKIGLEKAEEYKEIRSSLNSKLQIKENLMDNKTISEFNIEIDLLSKEINKKVDVNEYELENVSREIKTLENELYSTLLEEKEISERIFTLDERKKELLELEEQIYSYERELLSLNKKLESLNLAKDTIENLSKDIHNEFAPEINREISKVISDITGGKYSKVKIDDDLNINLHLPNSEKVVNIENLSGGTIDQIYFSLRYGITNSSANDQLPLILDDCFIQYDDVRLENMLKVLIEESNKRQIILFTCQNREIDILDKLNKEYNLIRL